jgi:5-methyltetrahydrofolate--homocysteine methyltransferase
VDIIGLSGLITPSLDEMVRVAEEMERRGLDQPLLIGGATTSPAHTAVKIDPAYSGPVIYVKDASRSVGVVQKLISETEGEAFTSEIAKAHARKRELHGGRSRKGPELSLEQARNNRFTWPWESYSPPSPAHPGIEVFSEYPLDQLVSYIDWMPFFNAWEFSGRFPDILDDPVRGPAARSLYDDARSMLRKILEEGWLRASGVIGLFPAASVGDDVLIYADENRKQVAHRLHFLREQRKKPSGKPNLCLADYVAPEDSGKRDWIGAFAVTAGLGIETHVERMEAEHDDYHAILLKALADRLAEAFAERMHERVRQEYWGYVPGEDLDNESLIREEYAGIRPAPGYPACPDHLQKETLWKLLDVEAAVGMRLTESYAMWPAASVSGFYFSHPESRYFSVGKIGRDQVEDYANRCGLGVSEVEYWLGPILGYPRDAA